MGRKKINQAFCAPGNVKINGPLSFCQFVVFPAFLDGKPFLVKRENEPDLSFTTFAELKEAFASEKIHPKELKNATFEVLETVLQRVRADFQSQEMKDLKKNAYPSKKQKSMKDNGGKEPSLKEVRAALDMSKRDAKRLIADVK